MPKYDVKIIKGKPFVVKGAYMCEIIGLDENGLFIRANKEPRLQPNLVTYPNTIKGVL